MHVSQLNALMDVSRSKSPLLGVMRAAKKKVGVLVKQVSAHPTLFCSNHTHDEVPRRQRDAPCPGHHAAAVLAHQTNPGSAQPRQAGLAAEALPACLRGGAGASQQGSQRPQPPGRARWGRRRRLPSAARSSAAKPCARPAARVCGGVAAFTAVLLTPLNWFPLGAAKLPEPHAAAGPVIRSGPPVPSHVPAPYRTPMQFPRAFPGALPMLP